MEARHPPLKSLSPSRVPELRFISVGQTSVFGHPHKEVVERWKASGAKC